MSEVPTKRMVDDRWGQPTDQWKLTVPLRNVVTFTGSDGRPVLVIDCDQRRIDVGEDVSVSDAAQAVIAAIGGLLLAKDK